MIKFGLTGPALLAFAGIAISQVAATNAAAPSASNTPDLAMVRDSAQRKDSLTDSVPTARPEAVAAKSADTTSVQAPAAKGPMVPLVVRGQAPAGSQVTLDGALASMDSTGKYKVVVATDSLSRSTGAYQLCLLVAGQNLCTKVRPQGFDTLDVAPLEVKIDSVVETRDTVRNVVDTTNFDSTALKATDAPKVVKSSAGRTVTIKGKRRPPRIMGQERVTVQVIRQMPGLAEPDVIRAVQALPGVVQSSDFSTKIYVRGSASDQNLVLFDNAVVYSPSHFGGLFGTFLADAVGGLDFYKGGFETKYGNRLASVLQVSSKNGGFDPDSGKSLDKWVKGGLRLTVFGGSGFVEGHQGEFSWIYAGRRTWVGEALQAARDAGAENLPNIGYYFYDQQGSAVWGRGNDSIRVSVYQGKDSLTLPPLNLEWGNLAVPLNVRKRIQPGLDYKGSLSWSEFEQTFKFADLVTAINGVKTLNTRQELVWDAYPGHQLTGGYEYNDFRTRFEFLQPAFGVEQKDNFRTDLHALYTQDRWVINPEVTLTGGVRGYYYPETDELSADPRLSATWRPAPNWKADLHLGYYHQYITSIRWSSQEQPNEYWYPVVGKLPSTKQSLLAVGVERSDLGPQKFRVTAEGYYKSLKDFLVFYPNQTASQQNEESKNASTSGIAASQVTAKGWAAGGEIAVNKEDGPVTGSISYGLSWSALGQDPFTNSLGTTIFDPTWADWDQRHTFKLSTTANWLGDGENSLWKSRYKRFYLRSTLQANYNSGTPLTGYDGYTSTHLVGQGIDGAQGTGQPVGLEGNTYVGQGFRNQQRKPDYFRADLTLLDIGQTGKWRVYYTIINLTDHDNVFNISYNTKENPPKQDITYQFPRLPFFLGAEYEF